MKPTALVAVAGIALCASGTLRAQNAAATTGGSDRAGFAVPAWLYPGDSAAQAAPAAPDATARLRVPRSRARFTQAQLKDLFAAPDWHPDTHPPMPGVVAHGRRPAVYACAYCHLPNGQGRPENAALAGLSAAYIAQQVADMRSGARGSAWRGAYKPWEFMHEVALSATEGEVSAAAAYFAALSFTPRIRVVEAARVPRAREIGWLYVRDRTAGTEALGQRIIETPLDMHRHELRDDVARFEAYVPPGSIARGRELATLGIDGAGTACVTCHGVGLRGIGAVPPVAGRSPTYIMRQLIAFRTGARATAAGEPMAAVAGKLALDEMIAAAAYSASLRP